LRTIQCADCGRTRQTRRSNTKYCYPCRLLRNIKWQGTETTKCLVCEKRFSPLKRGDVICGKCDSVPPPGDPRGTCAFCGTENSSLVDKEVQVCRPCATDPEQRGKLAAALQKKANKAREENQ
jgi:hypothetical protein